MNPRRVLALDPTTKGLAYVALEGSARLLDWGRVEPRAASGAASSREAKLLDRIANLVERYEPELLVVEAMASSRRGRRARKLIDLVVAIVGREGIEVRAVSGRSVRDHFGVRTKHDIAIAISKVFPELAPRLPRKRRPWESENERMGMFMAAGFALTALSALDTERID